MDRWMLADWMLVEALRVKILLCGFREEWEREEKMQNSDGRGQAGKKKSL